MATLLLPLASFILKNRLQWVSNKTQTMVNVSYGKLCAVQPPQLASEQHTLLMFINVCISFDADNM